MTTAVARTNAPVTVVLEGDPEAQLDYAHRAAKALMKRVEVKEKKITINGKQYLEFGDWQTLSRFFGATAATEWTRPIERNGKMVGYEARAIVYQHGNIISAAEGMCLQSEKRWSGRDWFALRSMAQTRACAKALRNAFGWVAELAGYSATPAEEMTEVRDNPHVNRPEDFGEVPTPGDPSYIPASDPDAKPLPKKNTRASFEAAQKKLYTFTSRAAVSWWIHSEDFGHTFKLWQPDWQDMFRGLTKAHYQSLPEHEEAAECDLEASGGDWLDTINDAYSKCEDAAAAFEVDKKLFLPFIGSVSPDDRDRAQTLRNEHLARIEGSPQ